MNMVVSPYSDAYGRKKFHIVGLLIFVGGTVACGLAQNIDQLIGFRIIQAFGSAAPAVVGSGSVTDMYEIAERGQALGFFLLGSLVGPGKRLFHSRSFIRSFTSLSPPLSHGPHLWRVSRGCRFRP